MVMAMCTPRKHIANYLKQDTGRYGSVHSTIKLFFFLLSVVSQDGIGLVRSHDPELNPEGEIKKEEPPQNSFQVKKKRNHSDVESLFQGATVKKRSKQWKTRWDAAPKPHYKPLGQWRGMTQVAGNTGASPDEILWREMVQKILYADATCGTSTAIETLDLLHF